MSERAAIRGGREQDMPGTDPGCDSPPEERTTTAAGPEVTAPADADAGADDGPEAGDLPLIAYRLGPGASVLDLAAPPRRRDWMDDTTERFANRCLPLLMANQSGWLLLSRHTFTVEWSGGPDNSAITIQVKDGEGACPAVSHFGHGILTFHVPYLFRTPPGWNLLARGPANCPKDGIAPLEGLIETDWAEATFTMNWKITRPGFQIEFRQGEPVCMIVPQRRSELERFRPQTTDLSAMTKLTAYLGWRQSRQDFIDNRADGDAAGTPAGWQRHYMRGTGLTGTTFADHQRKLRLRDWTDRPAPTHRCG